MYYGKIDDSVFKNCPGYKIVQNYLKNVIIYKSKMLIIIRYNFNDI